MQGRDWNNKENNVECWTLDNMCKNADIIKMDIEGFEHKILYDALPKMSTNTWLIDSFLGGFRVTWMEYQ